LKSGGWAWRVVCTQYGVSGAETKYMGVKGCKRGRGEEGEGEGEGEE
jgi:hypothetical protein